MAKLDFRKVFFSLLITVAIPATIFIQIANGLKVSSNSITGTLFKEGQNIILNCSTSSEIPVSISWSWSYHLKEPNITNGSTLNTPREYWSVLMFNATALDNSRDIVCMSSDGVNTKKKIITPTIILLPNTPVIEGPDLATALKPESWTCYSRGASYVPPNVYWRDGDETALFDGVTKSTELVEVPNENFVFNIKTTISIEFPAIKMYTLECYVVHVTSSYVVEKSISKDITVLFPPQICTEVQRNITLREMESVTIQCCVEANPPVTKINWFKNGVHIDKNTTKYSVASASDQNLTIRNVSLSDEGKYTCTAVNDIGYVSSPITNLFLKTKPIIQVPTTYIVLFENQLIDLVCNVSSLDTLTEFYWTKNGSQLSLEDTNIYSGGTLLRPNLTILAVTKADIGYYTCVASNAEGTTQSPNITVVIDNDCYKVNNRPNQKTIYQKPFMQKPIDQTTIVGRPMDLEHIVQITVASTSVGAPRTGARQHITLIGCFIVFIVVSAAHGNHLKLSLLL